MLNLASKDLMSEFVYMSVGRCLRREFWGNKPVPQCVSVYVYHADKDEFEYMFTKNERIDFKLDDESEVNEALRNVFGGFEDYDEAIDEIERFILELADQDVKKLFWAIDDAPDIEYIYEPQAREDKLKRIYEYWTGAYDWEKILGVRDYAPGFASSMKRGWLVGND